MFHVKASDRSGFEVCVCSMFKCPPDWSSFEVCVCSMFKRLILSGFDVCVCSMFKRLIDLVLRCAYVPCLSV